MSVVSTFTLDEVLRVLRELEPHEADALAAWFEDGTLASVITALGLSGNSAAVDARKIIVGASQHYAHIVSKFE
jgi:hypothetical protein